MRALIQRCKSAGITINDKSHSQISSGLVIFLGVGVNDRIEDVAILCKKIVNLRIFSDDAGKMNRSVQDIQGEILLVSQFTLLADTRKGNRPSFVHAAPPNVAMALYQQMCRQLEILLQRPIQTGVFGADMQVQLINDGPVTIWIDTQTQK